MILVSDHGRPAAPLEGLVCRRVENRASLESFSRTFSRANELPHTEFWTGSTLLEEPNWDFLEALLDGEPVATGFGYTFGGITGVWGIATVPAYRGRGIGSAITWAVVHAGRRRGARAAHLWATEMGYPVYRKMGFRHVQNMALWVFERPGAEAFAPAEH